jgi:hypothetical protein
MVRSEAGNPPYRLALGCLCGERRSRAEKLQSPMLQFPNSSPMLMQVSCPILGQKVNRQAWHDLIFVRFLFPSYRTHTSIHPYIHTKEVESEKSMKPLTREYYSWTAD